MRWHRLGLILTACRAESIEVAELGEVCGTAGPFRVLELPPEQQLVSQLHLGDRVLLVVGTRGVDEEDATFPNITTTTLWSTGPCGESPIKLATDLRVFTIDAWPDVPLACDEATGDVLSIDPTGKQPPHVVFADVPHTYGCGLRWTSHGLLSVAADDDEQGALLLHPYPNDPFKDTSEPIVLLDPIRITAGGRSGSNIIGSVLRALDDHALALTPDNTLVRVELGDGAVTELQTGVAAFDASFETGRYIVWQDEVVTHAEREDLPEGQLYLRDQNFASDVPLVQDSLAYGGSMRWAERGAIEINLGFVDRDPKRVVFIPGLDHVDISTGLFLNAPLDDGRWVVSWWNGAYVDIADLRTGESQRLANGPVRMLAINATSADFLTAPPCCIDGGYRDEGSLWRIAFDASPARRLAPRATSLMRRLAHGRIVTPINIDEQWLADLILVDPDTEAERLLDDHVYALSARSGWGDEPDIISYSVADGERSGIYLARLPPHETPRALPQPRADALVFDLLPGPDGHPVPRPRRITDPSPSDIPIPQDSLHPSRK